MAVRRVSVDLVANDRKLVTGLNRAATAVKDFAEQTAGVVTKVNQTGAAMTATMQDADALGRAMAQQVKIIRDLAAGQAKLTNAVTKVQGAMERQHKAAEQSNKSAQKNEKSWQDTARGYGKAALAGAGLVTGMQAVEQGARAVRAAFDATVVSAANFEASMRNVNTLAGMSEAGLNAMSEQILDLSTRLPQSAQGLAEGLYDVIGSGFDEAADSAIVLEEAAKAASAGLTTTENSVQAITAVLNAYGREAEDSSAVSDVLFATVDKGIVSFGQLTGVIGDVVGTAAAAKVPIEDVGAAIATITLSGIAAPEAGTSLNQLLNKLIQPSENLSRVYQDLGYQSGAWALETRGLYGVLEDLRGATGGNVEQILQLIPEVRAARGAFALMSNEGQSYARVQGEIADASQVTGATQRALAEQSKSARYQLSLIKNEAQAAGIRFGERLLPAIVAVATGLRDAAVAGGPYLAQAWSAVVPIIESLWQSGVNVLEVLQGIWETAQPAAAALLKVGGGAILSALRLLAETLETVTGFLADHQGIATALAAVYLARFIPALLSAVAAARALVTVKLVTWAIDATLAFGKATGGATTMTGAVKGLGRSLAGLAAANGPALALAGIAFAWQRMVDVQNQAKDSVEQVMASYDAMDTTSAQKTVADLTKMIEDGIEAQNRYREMPLTVEVEGLGIGGIGAGKLLWDTIFGGEDAKAVAAVDAGLDAMAQVNQQTDYLTQHVRQLAAEYGLTEQNVRAMVKAQDLDLARPWKDAKGDVQKFRDEMRRTQSATGVSMQQLQQLSGETGEAWLAMSEEIVKAVEQMTGATEKAMSSFTNVLGTWKDDIGVAELESATDSLEAAQQKLSDLRNEQANDAADAADKEKHLGGQIEKTAAKLREEAREAEKAKRARVDAEKEVGKAQQKVDEARKKRDEGTLENTYAKAIEEAAQFSADIVKVIEKGLDPQYVAKLLQAGPEQAGPVLEALLSDHSGRLIGMVNESEARLAELNRTVVEQARLTALAINSSTDELSSQLATAMKISNEAVKSEGAATAEQIAKAIGKPTDEVLEVAKNYGITIGKAVQDGINSAAPRMVVQAETVQGDDWYRQYDGSGRSRMLKRSGGLVVGPGTPTSDSIPALLSNKEFVQPYAAVSYYGVDVHEAIRQRQIPADRLRAAIRGYRDGGLVTSAPFASAPAAWAGGTSGGPQVVQVPVNHTTTHQRPINVGQVVAADVDDFRRKAEQEARLRQLGTVTG